MLTLCFCFQVLGPKPDLPPGASDDVKADASNRKRAKLYKVRVQVYQKYQAQLNFVSTIRTLVAETVILHIEEVKIKTTSA